MSRRDDEWKRERGFASIAKDLREFGYPDVTPQIVKECVDAWHAKEPAPHGVIGVIVYRGLDEGSDHAD